MFARLFGYTGCAAAIALAGVAREKHEKILIKRWEEKNPGKEYDVVTRFIAGTISAEVVEKKPMQGIRNP